MDAQYAVRIGHGRDQLRVCLVDASDMIHLLQQECDTELVRVVVFVFLSHEEKTRLVGIAAYDWWAFQRTRAIYKHRRLLRS